MFGRSADWKAANPNGMAPLSPARSANPNGIVSQSPATVARRALPWVCAPTFSQPYHLCTAANYFVEEFAV